MWFLKPAWQGKNEAKALSAVEKETDQAKLAEIYTKAPLLAVRQATIQRVTDQTVLTDLAKSYARNGPTLMEIMKNLTDQSTLADIAQNSGITYVRVAALDKLTDQALARNIFNDIMRKSKKSGDTATRIDAARRLTNQSLLAELAKNDINSSVRETAIEKLTDQEVLTQIAKYDVFLHVRMAAAKKLADRGLAEEIASKIEFSRRKNIESTNGISTTAAKQPSYNEIVATVKNIKNARDFHKIEETIQKLTSQNVLAEIIESRAGGWEYDRGVENYGPYNIIDLRDTARVRLNELKKNKPDANTQVQPEYLEKDPAGVVENTWTDYNPNQKPNTDLFFIVEALKNAPTISMTGLINGLVLMTPRFTKTIQKFPRNTECLYQIGLNSLPGLQVLDLLRDPAIPSTTPYYGTLNIFEGFPQLCLKCRKPVEHFELLMAPVANPQGMGRVSISADSPQEIFDILLNVRNFIAVPCCAEHSLANRFFFWMGANPFFTDDEDISKTCMAYSKRPGQVTAAPIKVVNGKIIS